MAINKVVYGDQTLVDLTSDTATAEDVAQGKTFHDASGQLRTGSNTGGTYTAGDGIDITNNVISLEYLRVVNGAVCLIYEEPTP